MCVGRSALCVHVCQSVFLGVHVYQSVLPLCASVSVGLPRVCM